MPAGVESGPLSLNNREGSVDWESLERHIEAGTVNRVSHPTLPLTLYNYSQRCQFERTWDDVTRQCRGLIYHGDKIVARPFPKFFNDGEHADGEIPWHLPCEVTAKMDGSLLIVFHFDGEWHFATRGSFISEQAKRGRDIFQERYGEVELDPAVTYLFEVIYPENRIVVDYGTTEDVVLLAMIEVESGNEVSLEVAPTCLSVVRRLPPTADAKSLRSIITDEEEGYVVRFANGFRMKVKGERYMQLHKLISGVSSRSIWEALSNCEPLEEMLAVIPDEFAEWVRQERTMMLAAFEGMSVMVEEAYLAVKDLPDRKSKAMRILADYRSVSSAAFAAIDGKDTSAIIWKQLYPEYRRPAVAGRIEA